MTKYKFMEAYAAALKSRHGWARDPEHLEDYLRGVWAAINGEESVWTPEGPALALAWVLLLGKGEPTLDILRALPKE